MDNNVWTPMMREGFVNRAKTSSEERGNQGYYWFNVMPKITKPDEESPKKALVTNALMNTVFENPEYRIFALKIYDILINKLTNNPFTRQHFQKNIVVQLKGGTSYTYLLGGANTSFPFSDLDIVIFINPFLPKDLFDTLKATVSTTVLQTISQYKRAIDMMFFSNKDRLTPEQAARQSAEQFLSDEFIASFKEDYNQALAEISDDEGMYVSPFENTEFRNMASKHSFIITESTAQEESIVRVEVPHFDGCERIPLRKTPMFCSYNETIRFNRASDSEFGFIAGSFDLYRIRFNNLYVGKESNADGKFPRENVTADFIDISIANQDDAELYEFWTHGQTGMIKDDATNIWIVIPDLQTMLNDLHKMLYRYECPESKREKRQQRYDILKELYNKNNMIM